MSKSARDHVLDYWDAAVKREFPENRETTEYPPLAWLGTMLDEMISLVRDAVAAEPAVHPHCAEYTDTPELEAVSTTIRLRRDRAKQFPGDWFSDPAWDILLFLFETHLQGVKVTVGDVGTGTDNRPTTAIRWLDIVETAGMLDRRRCVSDTRRVYVSLSEKGVAAMRLYFDGIQSQLPAGKPSTQ